jgi:hypothetical protein
MGVILLSGGIRVIFVEFFEEICLWMMPLIVLLKVGFRQEKLGAVTTLDHVLLLFRWQSHQVFVSAQGLLLDLELFLQ